MYRGRNFILVLFHLQFNFIYYLVLFPLSYEFESPFVSSQASGGMRSKFSDWAIY